MPIGKEEKMRQAYSYQETLSASEKIHWRVEDIIGGKNVLDFSKPFMPESLARVEPLSFLSPTEQLTLNQIRGNAYLSIFGLVEEFILPYVMDHARVHLNEDDYTVRSLLQFAGEEAKHIHLFRKFREEFERDFGVPCAVIGPAQDVAKEVLSHHPLSVAIAIMQIEWMTQRHYLDSVQKDQQLDQQFKNLLKYHWMEEAQHAKIDTLIVVALAQNFSKKEIESAVDGYIEIGGFIDRGLMNQVGFDMESLYRATGRKLSESEKTEFEKIQLQANRWTYLGSGMTHENFLATLERILPAARQKVELLAPAFC
jgi:hypothetical protein